MNEQQLAPVVLVGTLDTKAVEYEYLRARLADEGMSVLLVDAGVLGEPAIRPDISRDEVAEAAGVTVVELREGSRAAALDAMSRGAAKVVLRLHGQGRLSAMGAIGGSGAATLGGTAMQALPIGVPKILVSTMAASGDTRPFVGTSDIVLMNPVVDIAGLNRVSKDILRRAAVMLAALARLPDTSEHTRPTVGATMFGVTTPGVRAAAERLEELGYEVLIFHANGSGGQALERLAGSGQLQGVLDLTTTELADDLVGGVASAGPDRLTSAGASGLPQVVSLGALDIVNFWGRDSVPERFRGRTFYEHNPTATLMRTSADETAELGRRLSAKLNAARGPVRVLVPMGGLSALSVPGGPFYDPAADARLFDALREGLGHGVGLEVINTDINDRVCGRRAAEALHELMAATT